MNNIWKVLKKFLGALLAFTCYIFMLPMFIVGWTVYGFFRGITVWAWNVIEVGLLTDDLGDCWHFNISPYKNRPCKFNDHLRDPYARLHLTIDPPNNDFNFFQAFLGCAIKHGYEYVQDSIYDNLEHVFLIRRKDYSNV